MRGRVYDLLSSRSAVASLLRVIAWTAVIQCVLVCVLRTTSFSSRTVNSAASGGGNCGNDNGRRRSVVVVDRCAVARHHNASLINTKALLSHILNVLQSSGERMRDVVLPLAAADQLHLPRSVQHLERLSDREAAGMRRSLSLLLPPETAVYDGHDSAEAIQNSSNVPIVPLASRYRDDIHRVVWFDQWVQAARVTVWLSRLIDNSQLLTSYRLDMVTFSVCVSLDGRPHLSAVAYPFRARTTASVSLPPSAAFQGGRSQLSLSPQFLMHWGLYERGNDLDLKVSGAHRFLPERFGVVMDGDEATARLSRAAFGGDADLYYSGSVSHQLLAVLAMYADLALYTRPMPRRLLCPVHTLLRLYGGRMTDFSGIEVTYPVVANAGNYAAHKAPGSPGDSEVNGVLAALYYHSQLLDMLKNGTESPRESQIGQNS